MIQHNYIPVKSINNIRVVSTRYAVVFDTNGLYRVVSLVRTPARELQSSEAQGNRSYSFDSRGTGHKTRFGQRSLKSMASNIGREPTDAQLLLLTEHGVVTVIKDVKLVRTAKGGLDGIPTPINNRLLHSVTGGWIIGNVTKQGLDFSSQPKVHHLRTEAVTELGRLAKEFAGTEFVLFKVDMTAVADGVQTKTFQ
jgi:hypothetical protein